MSNAAFWPSLERRFRNLQPRHDNGLRALWYSTLLPNGRHWLLRDDLPRHRQHRRFRSFAEQGAIKLGHPGNIEAVYFWLDCLKDACPDVEYGRITETSNDGTVTPSRFAVIHRLCEASADYCIMLETGALLPVTPSPAQAARATRGPDSTREEKRCAFVDPRLREHGMTRSKWAFKAGVDPAVVYDYLRGKTNPRPESRACLAKAIGLQPNELPD
jgi:hypothetical protein